MRSSVLVVVLALAGCLGDSSANPPPGPPPGKADQVDGGAPSNDTDAAPAGNTDGAVALDGAVGGSAPDLFPSDIAGMTNCYGVALCDPAKDFCIKYHDGTQAAPGALSGGPACFEPATDCATAGQPMNCACIQADATLGANCAGSCLDHMDGTFECYKK